MPQGCRLHNAALRGYLIAVILAGLVWPALAQEAKRGNHHPGQSQAEAKQTPAQPSAAPAVSADRPLPKLEPKNYRNPCYAPKNADESDLCQQWRMAEATEETADWTYGQFLATGVEAVLLAIAIGVASWAGYWARRAAIAGAETVKITREIGMAQTRAYVGLASANIQMHDDGGAAYNVRFKNAGQTPGYHFSPRTTFAVAPYPLRQPLPKDDPTGKRQSLGIIHPRQSANAGGTLPGKLTPEYRDDIAAGTAAFFVHGEVTYRDAFDRPQTTTFRLMYTGQWGGQKPLEICEDGNDAT